MRVGEGKVGQVNDCHLNENLSDHKPASSSTYFCVSIRPKRTSSTGRKSVYPLGLKRETAAVTAAPPTAIPRGMEVPIINVRENGPVGGGRKLRPKSQMSKRLFCRMGISASTIAYMAIHATNHQHTPG